MHPVAQEGRQGDVGETGAAQLRRGVLRSGGEGGRWRDTGAEVGSRLSILTAHRYTGVHSICLGVIYMS